MCGQQSLERQDPRKGWDAAHGLFFRTLFQLVAKRAMDHLGLDIVYPGLPYALSAADAEMVAL